MSAMVSDSVSQTGSSISPSILPLAGYAAEAKKIVVPTSKKKKQTNFIMQGMKEGKTAALFRGNRFSVCTHVLFLRLQWPIEVRCRSPAVDQKIRTGDERASVAHEQLCDVGDFISRSGPSGRAFRKHIPIEITSRPVKFIKCQRRHNDAGGNGIDPRSFASPFDRFRHNSFYVATFCHLVSM